MQTTLELLGKVSDSDKKRILENLAILENVWKISVHTHLAQVSFEYITWADLKLVRRELQEMGYHIINDTQNLDTSHPH